MCDIERFLIERVGRDVARIIMSYVKEYYLLLWREGFINQRACIHYALYNIEYKYMYVYYNKTMNVWKPNSEIKYKKAYSGEYTQLQMDMHDYLIASLRREFVYEGAEID